MINISRLLCDSWSEGDGLRYAPTAHVQRAGAREGSGPVVVWNLTPLCNLRCFHCYYEAGPSGRPGMSREEGARFLADLAFFRVPVLLFSGGEPLLHPDFPFWAEKATELGIRVAVSTNGTLISPDRARILREMGVSYVGVSLDGREETNDRLRGVPGAFARALAGIRHCLEAGLRVGLRFTLTRDNVGELDGIFELVTAEGIPRVCFYHLVYSGRGSCLLSRDLDHRQTRQAVDLILRRALELHAGGRPTEVLTVDNHADGVYLYLWARRFWPPRAERIWELLRANGGNRSGIAIAAVDHEGNVYPDQFSRRHPVGNVRERSFSAIWGEGNHPLLRALRDRKRYLQGRCGRCRWLDICNGNFRARAEAAYGDFWAEDPACYLHEEELGWAGGDEQWTAATADC